MYINAGDVLTHLARHDEALENYRRALDIFPISPANRGKVGHQQQQQQQNQRSPAASWR